MPPILEQLFSTLEDIPLAIDLFSDGAGEVFDGELAFVYTARTSQYHVRSTTGNPHKHWCGLVCDELTGVADLLVPP